MITRQKMLFERKICKFGKIAKLSALSLMILSVGTTVVIACRFNPANHIEFRSTAGNHRVLAMAVDSADGCILVKACDWPYTFFSPFLLGEAAWPGRYASANCHWSKDGTLAVWMVQGVDEDMKRYESAYDFREHLGIDIEGSNGNPKVCNEAIAALVAERGGVESSALDIPSLNSGAYQ